MRFVMGVTLRNEEYTCEECSRTGDCYGSHALSCLRTGDIGRGHTCLKYALVQLLTHSGCTTVIEHPLPDAGADHPKVMDIVITSGLGTSQLAIDLTVVNPLPTTVMELLSIALWMRRFLLARFVYGQITSVTLI